MKKNRYENYKGFDNQEIIDLLNVQDNLVKQIKDIDNKIKIIQDNCDHDFLFYCSTGYYDEYICCKCGKCETS
jgi:hypothetical protein